MDKIGKRLMMRKKSMSIISTRTNQLDRPLNKINDIKNESQHLSLSANQ